MRSKILVLIVNHAAGRQLDRPPQGASSDGRTNPAFYCLASVTRPVDGRRRVAFLLRAFRPSFLPYLLELGRAHHAARYSWAYNTRQTDVRLNVLWPRSSALDGQTDNPTERRPWLRSRVSDRPQLARGIVRLFCSEAFSRVGLLISPVGARSPGKQIMQFRTLIYSRKVACSESISRRVISVRTSTYIVTSGR